MPGLVPGIHVFMALQFGKAWMAGTSPAMTVYCLNDIHATRSIFVTPPI